MIGSRNWLPRQVNCWVLLVLMLISPVSALAPLESADSPGSLAGKVSSGGGKPIDDIFNMDIEQLAKVDVRVALRDIPVCVFSQPNPVGAETAVRAGASASLHMIRKKGVCRQNLPSRGR